MISEEDRAYYERRYAEETARAAAAAKPEVAEAHRALAARYHERLSGGVLATLGVAQEA